MASLEQRLQRRVKASKFADEESDYDSSPSAAGTGVRGEAAAAATDLGSADDSLYDDDDDDDDTRYVGERQDGDSVDDGHSTKKSRSRQRRASPSEGDASDTDVDASDAESNVSDVDANALANISFGALASAQEALGPARSLKRKRNAITNDQEEEVAANARPGDGGRGTQHHRSPSPFHEAEERRAGKKLGGVASRASKHAPTEMSSKRAVSRKRIVVSTPTGTSKPQARDPRFSSLSGDLNESSFKANYSFLTAYRTDELNQLKTAARQEKNEQKRDRLKKQIKAIEDRNRAQKKVEQERDVMREHRRKERDAVKGGKQPFFLKRGEVKKQALMKQYEGLSEKKMDRVMEKRRKRHAQRERRNMPLGRRGAGTDE